MSSQSASIESKRVRELQRANEAVHTARAECQRKSEELALLAADQEHLLRSLQVGTLFLDGQHHIRRFTPPADRIVKVNEQDIGRSIEPFSHNLGPGFLNEVRTVCRTGEAIQREVRDGEGSWRLMRILPYRIRPDEIDGCVITFVEVSAIKNAQEMTKLANGQLAHANRELFRQREELEDFFSIVAHDLKRPLVALDGLVRLALDSGDDVGQARQLLKRGSTECAQMRRMLEDLVHVSALVRSELPMNQIDLHGWWDEFNRPFYERAEQLGVKINCVSDSGTIRVAQTVLEEALANLMENALNYGCTAEHPRIDVSVRIDENTLEVCVRDNGNGIEPRNHLKVFEPFRRLDPHMAAGSGLGLVAARRLLAKVGGSISLESELGCGAKFCIRLPIGETNGRSTADNDSPLRVLLVEDDALDAKIVRRQLDDRYAVTHVTGVSDAERRLQRELFDVVLLDLSLPDGHGFDLVRRARTELGLGTPIIVLTGHGEGVVGTDLSSSVSSCVLKSDLRPNLLEQEITAAIQQAGRA